MKALHADSLEERVRAARLRLALIWATQQLDSDTAAFVGHDVLSDAVAEAAREALAILGPLTEAPGEIGNWTHEGGEAQ